VLVEGSRCSLQRTAKGSRSEWSSRQLPDDGAKEIWPAELRWLALGGGGALLALAQSRLWLNSVAPEKH